MVVDEDPWEEEKVKPPVKDEKSDSVDAPQMNGDLNQRVDEVLNSPLAQEAMNPTESARGTVTDAMWDAFELNSSYIPGYRDEDSGGKFFRGLRMGLAKTAMYVGDNQGTFDQFSSNLETWSLVASGGILGRGLLTSAGFLKAPMQTGANRMLWTGMNAETASALGARHGYKTLGDDALGIATDRYIKRNGLSGLPEQSLWDNASAVWTNGASGRLGIGIGSRGVAPRSTYNRVEWDEVLANDNISALDFF